VQLVFITSSWRVNVTSFVLSNFVKSLSGTVNISSLLLLALSRQYWFLFGRYDHPLLVEKREKGDWVLPITVYAPPQRRRATHGRNDRSVLVGNLFNS
jgi:hypothetical protein